jgi:hypothetical protein
MTQPSASRNTRTGGLRRPALALALGAATASSVIAPIAAMAVTQPAWNDNGHTAGASSNVMPTKIASSTARLTALPAIPYALNVTPGTYNADINIQAVELASKSRRVVASYNALSAKYNTWKTAATPVINAYIAWQKAPTAQKTAKHTAYTNAKKAYDNTTGPLPTNKGASKWSAYSTAWTTYIGLLTTYTNTIASPYTQAVEAIKKNHFTVPDGTYGGSAQTAPGLCTTADNMTDQELYDAERRAGVASPIIGASDGDATNGHLIFRCNNGRLEYFLKNGSKIGVPAPIWEYLSASPTFSGGQVASVGIASDAQDDSASTYTPYITDYTSGTKSFSPWTTKAIPSTRRSDFNAYALNLLNKSGVFDSAYNNNFEGFETSGQTCISGATGATLTCMSYERSLQQAINAAVKGLPY